MLRMHSALSASYHQHDAHMTKSIPPTPQLRAGHMPRWSCSKVQVRALKQSLSQGFEFDQGCKYYICIYITSAEHQAPYNLYCRAACICNLQLACQQQNYIAEFFRKQDENHLPITRMQALDLATPQPAVPDILTTIIIIPAAGWKLACL